jgi:hypothetical protein
MISAATTIARQHLADIDRKIAGSAAGTRQHYRPVRLRHDRQVPDH